MITPFALAGITIPAVASSSTPIVEFHDMGGAADEATPILGKSM